MTRIGIVLLVLFSGCDRNKEPECLQGVRSKACRQGKADQCRVEFNNCNDNAFRAVECTLQDDGALGCACESPERPNREPKSIGSHELHTLSFDAAVDFVNRECSEFTYTGKSREWAWDDR